MLARHNDSIQPDHIYVSKLQVTEDGGIITLEHVYSTHTIITRKKYKINEIVKFYLGKPLISIVLSESLPYLRKLLRYKLDFGRVNLSWSKLKPSKTDK